MADDSSLFRRRRENAARAFTARRAELGLTQEEVARRAGVAPRTVQNFEAGVWPNPRTRALLEKALGWPAGELHRLASPPQPDVDPQLLDRIRELSGEERDFLISWLVAAREPPPAGAGRRRA